MGCRQMCAGVLLVIGLWTFQGARADEWLGQDKADHFTVTAALSSAVMATSSRSAFGFWAGVAAGAAKEVWDRKHANTHQASGKDFFWSMAGAYVGSQEGAWMLKRSGGQTVLMYSWRF